MAVRGSGNVFRDFGRADADCSRLRHFWPPASSTFLATGSAKNRMGPKLDGWIVEEVMTKRFRSDGLNQSLSRPPSLHDWRPENHLARFVVALLETLDLSAFFRSYEAADGRGQAAYALVTIVRLVQYSPCPPIASRPHLGHCQTWETKRSTPTVCSSLGQK